MTGPPNLVPFSELRQELSEDVYEHIRSMYEAHYRALRGGARHDAAAAADEPADPPGSAEEEAERHTGRFLDALKKPPETSFVRVNHFDDISLASPASSSSSTDRERVDAVIRHLTETAEEWIRQQQQQSHDAGEGGSNDVQLNVGRHEVLPDAVSVRIELNSRRPRAASSSHVQAGRDGRGQDEQPTQPNRRKRVICDRRCGEAIMRGSNVFVRGILCADPGILPGDVLDVFVDVPSTRHGNNNTDQRRTRGASGTPTRGLHVDKYAGRAAFLGRGVADCSRPDFFRLEAGVAVRMSLSDRVGPVLPPLPAVPGGVLQNVPSILVGHALEPRPRQAILDMCAAPGGKTLHVASLVRNQATIVACDRSRSKMVAARAMFREQGATCIYPLAVDSARLLENPSSSGTTMSVEQILSESQVDGDGLLTVRQFPPESFDRIVLDPPCSALGLRPKLAVELSYRALQSFASHQRKLAAVAIQLLKPGGILTYSTCTINHEENEQLVRHVLDLHGHAVQLERIGVPLGGPGLAGAGLDEFERSCVRRFDPADDPTDSIGFFLAKFRKRENDDRNSYTNAGGRRTTQILV